MLPFRTGSASCHLCLSLHLGVPDALGGYREVVSVGCLAKNQSSLATSLLEPSTPVFLQMEVLSVPLWVELYNSKVGSGSKPCMSCEAVCSAECPGAKVEDTSSLLGGLFNLKAICSPPSPTPHRSSPSCLDSVTSYDAKYNSANRRLCIQK